MIPREYGKCTAINTNMTDAMTLREFIDKIEIGGLQNTDFYLKVAAIIMCIRNLSPSLKKVSTLRIIALLPGSVRAVYSSKEHFKIKSKSFDIEVHSQKKCHSLVRISYAMTINKSQC